MAADQFRRLFVLYIEFSKSVVDTYPEMILSGVTMLFTTSAFCAGWFYMVKKCVKLTKKQLAVLEFLEDFTEENGYSPSYREIMAGLGLTSVSAVAEHVENLVEKGVLKKVPGAARSLEILDYKHESTIEFFKVRMLECTEEEKRILLKAAEILGIEVD